MESLTRNRYVGVPDDFKSLVSEQATKALEMQIQGAVQYLTRADKRFTAVIYILESLVGFGDEL